jgi:hypothetical protein
MCFSGERLTVRAPPALTPGLKGPGIVSRKLSWCASGFASASGPAPTLAFGSGKRFLPTPGVSGVGLGWSLTTPLSASHSMVVVNDQ